MPMQQQVRGAVCQSKRIKCGSLPVTTRVPPNDSNCKDRSEHLTNTNKQKLYTFCANEMSSQKESQHDQYKENINRNITATMVQSIPSSNNDMNSQYYRPINGNKSKALLRCVVTANQNHLNGSSNLMSKQVSSSKDKFRYLENNKPKTISSTIILKHRKDSLHDNRNMPNLTSQITETHHKSKGQAIALQSSACDGSKIIIDASELKAFTNQFAREKLELDVEIQRLRSQYNELQEKYRLIQVQRNDLKECLTYMNSHQEQLLKEKIKISEQLAKMTDEHKYFKIVKEQYQYRINELTKTVEKLKQGKQDGKVEIKIDGKSDIIHEISKKDTHENLLVNHGKPRGVTATRGSKQEHSDAHYRYSHHA